ncbi:MAG: apolipoprotein N-acyltransferase [Rhizomicrobium sp.]|nr:apolipoprotein N-acyltransferase [Rhizomicrobium sp.]
MMSWVATAGEGLTALAGWRRLGAALLAGLISALGFAPFGFFPCLLLGFATLVLLLDGATAERRPVRAAAFTGFAFGFGQFALGLHWIGYAFLVDADSHAWQIPFVALLFPGGLALFTAAAAAAAATYWKQGASRIFALTAAYSLSEWLRGHILTGFPWNIAGYGWGASLALLQTTAVIGVYGLSLFTVLFGASLAELFVKKPRWPLPALLGGLFVLGFAGGALRLAATPHATVTQVQLRLVQPNIPQADKYSRRLLRRNWQRLLELSSAPGNPSIIIWPEAAPPFLLAEQPLALEEIAGLTKGRLGLMSGAVRRDFSSPDHITYANSFFLFGPSGAILDIYDKSHLVPFGEYLPLEKTLTVLGLSKLTGIDGSFTPGKGPEAFALPGAGSVTPLICYEILFPDAVVGSKRPDWFVNITDDSWFGPWAGPRQHLLVARVRAIEEGLPVVRDANTGISAIIDPFGRITQQLGLGKTGIVDGVLPAAIAVTPYSRIRSLAFWLLFCAITALTWALSQEKVKAER